MNTIYPDSATVLAYCLKEIEQSQQTYYPITIGWENKFGQPYEVILPEDTNERIDQCLKGESSCGNLVSLIREAIDESIELTTMQDVNDASWLWYL